MEAHGLLQELVLVYAVAVVLLLVAGRLRVPGIVALITAGIVAGPSALGLITSKEDVDVLAEIGVALLLFMAGLDFSVGQLRRVWRLIVVGGSGQVILTGLIAAGLALALGGGSATRLFIIGLFVALSSTAIVIQVLSRRNEVHAPHGRLAVGVLLLQDVVVIGVLALAPLLIAGSDGAGLALAVGRLLLVLAGLALFSRLVLARLLRFVTVSSREAFPMAVLLVSIGTAWLASLLGLSMAVGAFLAGLVLAESEFSHQVHAEVRPLRDLLASLFFISVGLLVNVSQLVSSLPLVLGLATIIVLVKMGGAGAAMLFAGSPVRVAAASALALAQVGEFSFVLGRTAVEGGVLSSSEWQTLLGASVLTMAATPLLVGAAPRFGAAVAARLSRQPARAVSGEDPVRRAGEGHVIILGYGVGGRILARALRELRVPYLVMELNGATVQEGIAAGEAIRYGDATVPETLLAAGLPHAAALVAVLSDPDATERAVRAARGISTEVPIIVRTRFRLEAQRMAQAGATLAVAEELEASLEVLGQLLARLNVPGNAIQVLVDGSRRAAGAAEGRPARAPRVPLGELPTGLADAPVETHRLDADAWAVGRTLREIDLRARTGATVLAIARGGVSTPLPAADFTLEAADVLFLQGEDADVALARHRLVHGDL
ncbi:MAG: cation:proton antiporter [Acidobacteriota bacterium]